MFKFLCSNLRKVSHFLTGPLKHHILQFLNSLEKLETKEYAAEWSRLAETHPLWTSEISNSRLVNEVLQMLISQAAHATIHQSIIVVCTDPRSFSEILQLTLWALFAFHRLLLSNLVLYSAERMRARPSYHLCESSFPLMIRANTAADVCEIEQRKAGSTFWVRRFHVSL